MLDTDFVFDNLRATIRKNAGVKDEEGNVYNEGTIFSWQCVICGAMNDLMDGNKCVRCNAHVSKSVRINVTVEASDGGDN